MLFAPKDDYSGLNFVSPCRVITKVKTKERVCSLLFTDGPCMMGPRGEEEGNFSVSDSIYQALEKYGAKGTFALVGSTAENYPDDIGFEGTGAHYSHFPQYESDELGGAFTHPFHVAKLVAHGHEIVNHSCRHIPFGGKGLKKGRVFYGDMPSVLEDLKTFDEHFSKTYAYHIKFCLPPLGKTDINGILSVFDACTIMRYCILGYSMDLGGDKSLPDGGRSEEIAMLTPVVEALDKDENALCGQILRIHEGFHAEGRATAVEALPKLLALLRSLGYRVITVSDLVQISPFSDLGDEDVSRDDVAKLLAHGFSPLYRDNRFCPNRPITRGEAAFTAAPFRESVKRLVQLQENGEAKYAFTDLPMAHPYAAAAKWAVEEGLIHLDSGRFHGDKRLSRNEFNAFINFYRGRISPLTRDSVSRAEFCEFLANSLKED